MPPRGRNRRPKRGLSGAFIVMGIMSLLYSGVFPLFRLFDYAVLALVMLGAGKIYRAVVKKIHQKEDEAAEEEERRERQREEYARKRREAAARHVRIRHIQPAFRRERLHGGNAKAPRRK